MAVLIPACVSKTDDLTVVVREDGVVLFLTRFAQSNALILKTNDGGRTWRQVYRSNRLNEIIWKVSFANSRVGYATLQNDDPANAQQRVVKTVDGGEHPMKKDVKEKSFSPPLWEMRAW